MSNIQIIDTLGIISSIVALPFYSAIQYYFLKNFLGFKYKTWRFICLITISIIFNFLALKLQSPLTLIVNNLLWFIFLCYLCNGNFILKLYATILPNTILLLICIIFLSLDYYFSYYISKISISSEKEIFILFMVNIIRELLNLAPLFLILRKISKLLNFKEKVINIYQSLQLLTPCLGIYSLVLIFYFIQAIHVDDKEYYLVSIFPKIYLIVPFVSITILFSILVHIYIFKRMLDGDEVNQRNLLMEQQFKLQINHSKNVEGLYSDIRCIKHDMKNHIICLKKLIENRNMEELDDYLNTFGRTLSSLDYMIKTGNPISDAIINEKYSIAKIEDIEFTCDLIIPTGLLLNPMDLCILLGNALDNAIEACTRIKDESIKKNIFITSYFRDLYLIIEVSNSTQDKILYNDNKIISQKEDKLNHGIGISNIEMIVKKYNGTLDIMLEKNKFTLNIMLKVKDD